MLAGLFGGLALGYVLSRDGGWLTPGPWVVYTVLLVCAVAMLSLVDERRRLRVAEEELAAAAWLSTARGRGTGRRRGHPVFERPGAREHRRGGSRMKNLKLSR